MNAYVHAFTTAPYADWSPDSGTAELPSLHRGTPLADLDTVPMPFWFGLPSVPTRVVRPRRFARFRKHLRASADVVTFSWLLAGSLLVLAVFALHALQTLAPISTAVSK